jgi:hypothetical protein
MTDAPAAIRAFHVEAKLHAFRKTQEGVVVSFVVSPIDMPQALALDPLGTRYMLALCAISDDETPIASAPQSLSNYPQIDEKEFERRQRAKTIYANGTPGEQARTRASLLAGDPRFSRWVFDIHGYRGSSPEQFIRDRCCFGKSRKLIAEDQECLERFLAMETDYRLAVGLIPEPR